MFSRLTYVPSCIFSSLMKIKKNYLLSPGPTPVPPEAVATGAWPLIHHRTPQFQKIIKEVAQGLKYLFQTENSVYCAPASGTGMMEAAVANLMSAGETMIVGEAGKFGERWSKIGKVFGKVFRRDFGRELFVR